MFTPAAEAVGGLFSSLPQSGSSQGSSAARASNLRQKKSDPALTVAMPGAEPVWVACLPACMATPQTHSPKEIHF